MRPAQTVACGILLVLAAAGCGDDKAQSTEPVVATPGGAGNTSATPSGASGATATTTRAGNGASSTTSATAGSGNAGSGQATAPAQGGAGGSAKQADAGAGGASAAAMSTPSTPSTMGTHAADGTDPSFENPYPGYKSENYGDDKLWMCKPGLSKNYCIDDIADATEALPDGTFKPYMDDLRTDHPYDCIFWYPTVNRTEDPTSLDFSDPEPMLSSIRGQAARFSRVCNVYAPFYRQRSLNNGGDAELGYKDVVDSFKHYMAHWNKGRYFVVYGHSQGTGHASRLIKDEINNKPELRKRKSSTLPSGGGQYLEIDYAGKADDKRKHFLDLTREIGFGLHVFDYNFLMDDMVELVRSQAAAMSKAKP